MIKSGEILRVCIIGVATLVLIAGCATPPKVRVDKDSHTDFASYKTFAWFESTAAIEPQKTSTLVGERVRAAVIAALQSKGYVLSEVQPDFRVSYLLNAYERPRESGMRLGLGAAGSSGNVGGGVGVSIPLGKRTEIAAAMTLDIIDGKRNAQVWTGTYETVVSDVDIKDTDANLLVAAILAKFPGP